MPAPLYTKQRVPHRFPCGPGARARSYSQRHGLEAVLCAPRGRTWSHVQQRAPSNDRPHCKIICLRILFNANDHVHRINETMRMPTAVPMCSDTLHIVRRRASLYCGTCIHIAHNSGKPSPCGDQSACLAYTQGPGQQHYHPCPSHCQHYLCIRTFIT